MLHPEIFIFLFCIFIHGRAKIKFNKQNENSAAFIHLIRCRMMSAFSYKIKRGHQCRRCVYCFNCYLHAFAHWNYCRGVAMAFAIHCLLAILWARRTLQTSGVSDCRLFCCFAAVYIVAMRLFFDFYFIVFPFFHAVTFERVLFLIQEKKTIVWDWVSRLHQEKIPFPGPNGETWKNLIFTSTTITNIVLFAVAVYGREWVENPQLATVLKAFVE